VWREALHDLGEDDPLAAVSALVAIADDLLAGGEDQLLCDLGAGPIEDLLCHGAAVGEPVLRAMTAAAQRSMGFRQALGCVWWRTDLDDATVAFLRRFGPPPLPDRPEASTPKRKQKHKAKDGSGVRQAGRRTRR
jgi:hypothetical protein